MTPINISYKQARILYDSGCREIACHAHTSAGAIRYALAEKWEAWCIEAEHRCWHYAILVE